MPKMIKLDDGSQILYPQSIQVVVGDGLITDAEGVFFARQLEYLKSKVFEVEYADKIARDLFPVSNEAGPGVASITYTVLDRVGMAKIINAYANDLPRADVFGRQVNIPVRTLATSYGYNFDEVQASSRAGTSLDAQKAKAARESIEQTINDIAFFGDAEHGLPGFFSNANITTGNVVNGAGGNPGWTTKTPDEILFDVNDAFGDIFTVSQMKERGNTLLLPPSQWNYIATTPRASNSDTTILKYLVDNSPFLNSMEDVIPCNECVAANNANITNDAMVVYNRSPEKLELEIPQEMIMHPVQVKGLEFMVPVSSRIAGVNIYKPLSVSILEDI